MTFRKQLQWGGLVMILVALIVSITNALFYVGIHNTALHAWYGVGYTGLILTAAIVHVAQARRAGVFELVSYLLSVSCLAYVNVSSFMDLVAMAKIPGTEQAVTAVRSPFLIAAIYGLYLCLILFYAATAQVGVLSRWGGILTGLGIALQLPAQFASNLAGPMFYIFSAGGSVVFGIGLTWLGWSLWSGIGISEEEPRLSILDRSWGAPFVIVTAFILALNGYVNSSGRLALANGILNVTGLTALMLSVVILFTAQADRAGGIGWVGFIFSYVGAALAIIPAYLRTAQLAGQIDSSRALLASLEDFPFGKVGIYMLVFGALLFGVSMIRANVFPRWSNWLFLVGTMLLLPFGLRSQASLFLVFRMIGATLLGISLGGMGWSLWKKKESTNEAPKALVETGQSLQN